MTSPYPKVTVLIALHVLLIAVLVYGVISALVFDHDKYWGIGYCATLIIHLIHLASRKREARSGRQKS